MEGGGGADSWSSSILETGTGGLSLGFWMSLKNLSIPPRSEEVGDGATLFGVGGFFRDAC